MSDVIDGTDLEPAVPSDPDVLQRQKLDAFVGAVRLLGSEVRRLRAELEER